MSLREIIVDAGHQLLHKTLLLFNDLISTDIQLYTMRYLTLIYNFGNILQDQCKFSDAEDAYKMGLSMANAIPLGYFDEMPSMMASFHNNLGTIHRERYELSEAEKHLKKAETIWRDLCEIEPDIYATSLSRTLSSLANIYSMKNKYVMAENLYNEAMASLENSESRHKVSSQHLLSAITSSYANMYKKQYQYPKASQKYKESLGYINKIVDDNPIKYNPYKARILIGLAHVLVKQHDIKKAKEVCDDGVKMLESLKKREGDIYDSLIAWGMSTYGEILLEEGNLQKAHKTYSEVIRIRESLSEKHHGIYKKDVIASKVNLGIVYVRLGQFVDAERQFNEADVDYKALHGSDVISFASEYAQTLSSMGINYRSQRKFEQARKCLFKALKVLRKAAKINEEIFAIEFGTTYTNLGNVFWEIGNLKEAIKYHKKAVEAYTKLMEDKSDAFAVDCALAMSNMANVYRDAGETKKAKKIYMRAYDLLTQKNNHQSDTYLTAFSALYNNLANILADDNKFDSSEKMYIKAKEVRTKLSESMPSRYLPELAMTLNNYGNLLEKTDRYQESLEASKASILVAEDERLENVSLKKAKGLANSAYRRLLAHWTQENNVNNVYHTLSAMTDVDIRSKHLEKDYLLKTINSLMEIERKVNRRIGVIIIHSLRQDLVFMGFLQTAHPYLQVHICGGETTKTANEVLSFLRDKYLFNTGQTSYATFEETNNQLDDLLNRFRENLPDFLIHAFQTSRDYEIMINSGPEWHMFPWEGLQFGTSLNDHIGLHSALSRVPSVSNEYIQKLLPRKFGNGDKTASIFAPWDTLLLSQLPFANEEAQMIFGLLKKHGYKLIPNDDILLGTNATEIAMNDTLTQNPSLLHFTGHGGIENNEEVLLLWTNDTDYEITKYGRLHIDLLKRNLNTDGMLFNNHPLIILNSCFGGRSREFGGDREDLLSYLLKEGAETIVASPAPIQDRVGQVFGEEFYTALVKDSCSVGDLVVKARRILAKTICSSDKRLWPAWMLLSCHGNPFSGAKSPQ